MVSKQRLDSINSIETWLGKPLPTDYVRFLESHEEQCFGDQVYLYSAEALIERNETYETQTYCPGYISIGDDSGGRAIVISVAEPLKKIFIVDYGSMSPCDFHEIPQDFDTWISNGCPCPE